jgi:uncharacterized coiled-coil DUF342 family protein
MAGNDINIGSLLFDVGLDPAQVAKLTSDLRQVGREAKQNFERSGKAADPLTDRIRELNQRVKTLTEQYKAGQVTADQYRQGMGVLRHEFERTNKETGLTQKQMGDLAKGYRTAKAAVEPLKVTITEFRARLNSLREQVEAGTLSEKQFAAEARKLRAEIHAQIATTQKGSQQFLQLKNVLGTTTRSINSAEGQMSKLGIAAQVNIALNQRFANTLRTMGPAGSAAALGLTALGNNAGGLIPTFGVKLPAALQTTLGMLTTLQVLAPAAIGVGLVALTRFADKAADAADAIDKNSQAAGLSIEAYQELAFTFDQSGINADQFRQAMGSLNRRLGEAAVGNRAYADSYDRLGVSIRDANGHLRDSEEVMLDALEALGRLPSSAEQASLAAKLFGDDVGKKLVPVINQGADGIEDLRQKARDLGLVLSGDAVLSLVGYKDEMAALRQQFSTAGIEITASFLPILRDGLIPLLQEQVVPWVQSLAENLSTVSDNFLDAGITGAMFRDQIADLISPFVQLVALIGAASAGINKLNLDIQLFGSDLGQRLGLGNADLRRGVDQFLGMFGINDTGFLDSPLFGFPSQGGSGRDNQRAQRDLFQQDMNDWVDLFLSAGDVSQSAVDGLAERLAEQREQVRKSYKALTDSLGGGDGTSGEATGDVVLDAELQRLIDITMAHRRSTTGEAATGSDRQFASVAARLTSADLAQLEMEATRRVRESDRALRVRGHTPPVPSSVRDAALQAQALMDPAAISEAVFEKWREAGAKAGEAYITSLGRTIAQQAGSLIASLEEPLAEAEKIAARLVRERARAGRVAAISLSVPDAVRDAQVEAQRTRILASRTLTPEQVAFNQDVNPFRAREGDGGLADLLFTQAMGGRAVRDDRLRQGPILDGGVSQLLSKQAKEATEKFQQVQDQVAELAGKAPSQFDQMRTAVEEFGLAAGKTPEEIAELTAEIDKLEAQDKLVGTLNDISSTLRSIGGAAAGTPLGDFASGMGELVDVASKFASGDVLGGITAVAAEIISGFTAASKAAQKLTDDLAGIQSGFNLIDSDQLVKTTVEQVGSIFFMPVYGEVVDEAASALGLSIAEALEGGVLSGLRNGFEAYLESGDIKDLENGLKDGFRTAVIDAIFEALIEGAIVEGALGEYLTELTAAIAAGDTDAANAAIDKINAEIPHLAEVVAEYAGQINIPEGAPEADPTGSDLATNPTGISVPIAPTPVMAAPAWVPEMGAHIAQFGDHVQKFGRNVSRMNNNFATQVRDA